MEHLELHSPQATFGLEAFRHLKSSICWHKRRQDWDGKRADWTEVAVIGASGHERSQAGVSGGIWSESFEAGGAWCLEALEHWFL